MKNECGGKERRGARLPAGGWSLRGAEGSNGDSHLCLKRGKHIISDETSL